MVNIAVTRLLTFITVSVAGAVTIQIMKNQMIKTRRNTCQGNPLDCSCARSCVLLNHNLVSTEKVKIMIDYITRTIIITIVKMIHVTHIRKLEILFEVYLLMIKILD